MKSQEVLAALAALIDGAAGAVFERNSVVPENLPAQGLIILRDGDPGEPETQMSPPAWLYEHRASADVIVCGDSEEDRAALLDAILSDIGSRLAADRTLGGLCDHVEPRAPQRLDVPVEGAEPLKAVSVAIILSYEASDPLA
jgi:hypothetical protein